MNNNKSLTQMVAAYDHRMIREQRPLQSWHTWRTMKMQNRAILIAQKATTYSINYSFIILFFLFSEIKILSIFKISLCLNHIMIGNNIQYCWHTILHLFLKHYTYKLVASNPYWFSAYVTIISLVGNLPLLEACIIRYFLYQPGSCCN